MNYPHIMQPALRLFTVLGSLSLPLSAAASSDEAGAGGPAVHWEAGLTYASGISKVTNQIEANFAVTKKSIWPVGLKLGGYAEYASGWGFGGSVGPWEVIRIDHGRYFGSGDSSYNYIVPITLDARYFFSGEGQGKVYVRAGLTQPIVGGDYLGSGTVGPVVAIGSEVWHGSHMSVGMEAGYDGSKVEVKGTAYNIPAVKVTPVAFTVGLFVRF